MYIILLCFFKFIVINISIREGGKQGGRTLPFINLSNMKKTNILRDLIYKFI